MADQNFNVVIVGGGAIGSAIAYFLARDPGFGGTIAVIERDPTYRTASSALSASGIRQQFTTQTNIEIGRFGISFLREANEHLAIDGQKPEIGLLERGYLFLADEAHAPVMREANGLQRRLGAEVELLTPDALRARFPWLDTEGIALASLGLTGEGWFDGYGLLTAFRRKAQSLGATYIQGEVVALGRRESAVVFATLADGTRIGCGTLVNAAGPYARLIAEMAGVTIPVESRKRSVFVFDCRQELPRCPLVIDASGIWFRPEGKQFITSVSPPEDEDRESFSLDVDHDLFEATIWPALAARVPAFQALKQTASWAGRYEYNTLDQNALLGPHPELANFICANGFSGHGLQQSPAVGRGIAELIAYGGYKTLDLTPLSVARVFANHPLRELHVV